MAANGQTPRGPEAENRPVPLSLHESVPLATALVQHVARGAGIRLLVIKGPLAAATGLRPQRASSDVDVLVEPQRTAEVIELLGRRGWQARPIPDFPRLLGWHSRTLIHPQWGCDIDVHHRWPGFLADPAEAFETLWRRHSSQPLAGLDIEVPGVEDAALILALHSLREAGHVSAASRQMVEYRYLLSELQRRSGEDVELPQRLLAAARSTGSEQTALPLLRGLGLQLTRLPDEADEQLRLWRLNSRAQHPMTAWLLQLHATPWYRKPFVALRAVFPRPSELRAIDPAIGPGPASVVAGWWRRVRRGLSAAPQAERLLRRFATDAAPGKQEQAQPPANEQ